MPQTELQRRRVQLATLRKMHEQAMADEDHVRVERIYASIRETEARVVDEELRQESRRSAQARSEGR